MIALQLYFTVTFIYINSTNVRINAHAMFSFIWDYNIKYKLFAKAV